MLVIPETVPEHATACLGIINAQDNGFGVTGIAPDAQAYFFPLTSVETGPRTFDAFMSAFTTLGPGDVISCSFGPDVSLNNALGSWTLLRLGSDLGITAFVAAANECLNLSDEEDLGESGAVVCGAGTPGRPYSRLTFSNYFEAGEFGVNGNIVHYQAWGSNIAPTGGYDP